MKNILFITNIAKKVGAFSVASRTVAHKRGMMFHSCANWSALTKDARIEEEKNFGIKIHHVDLARSPFSFANIKAYKQVCEIIKREEIDCIHCNTPIGGILGRLAGRKCGVKKIIYQVHGFHFYKGAPKRNWLLYYPVEKWLAKYTDALITINKDDAALAKSKLKLRNNGKVYYVPGVGIDTAQYGQEDHFKTEKRKELGIPDNAFVLISVGELNENKNNGVVISAMAKLKRPEIHYVLCGVGNLQDALQKQADVAGLHSNVHFLGYRNDVRELYQMADCFVMPSFREGLSRSIMEAMSSGLPCVVSKIRGNVDLIEHGKGGYLCAPANVDEFTNAFEILHSNDGLRKDMGFHNLERIKDFDITVVTREIERIYNETFSQTEA